MLKKATNLVQNAFFKKNFVFANLKYINSYNMKKKNVSLYNFRTYFFPLFELTLDFRFYWLFNAQCAQKEAEIVFEFALETWEKVELRQMILKE